MCMAITGIPAVSDSGVATDVPDVSPVPLVLISAKCDLLLKIILIAYHYYVSIEGEVTPENMNYTNFLKVLYVEN